MPSDSGRSTAARAPLCPPATGLPPLFVLVGSPSVGPAAWEPAAAVLLARATAS